MNITAAIVDREGGFFPLQDAQLGELRQDELLIRVRAAGICHTDIVVRDQWYPVPLPVVLGHEGGGIVEQVESAVSELWRQGTFPLDRIVTTYDFDAIDQAIHDAEAVKVTRTAPLMS